MVQSFIDILGAIFFPFRRTSFSKLNDELGYTVAFLLNIALMGGMCIILLHIRTSWQHAALSLLTALALFAVGSLIGFILALPRISLDQLGYGAPAKKENGGSPAAVTARAVSPIGLNNNLVDISDWITKSVLTLSIANSEDLIPALKEAANYLAIRDTATASPEASTEAMAIIIGYSCIGMLYAYIVTRTIVTSLLAGSTSDLLEKRVMQDIDNAGRMAVKSLDPGPDGDEPRRSDVPITDAEKATASAIATQISDTPVSAIRFQLEQLAGQYADIRANQKPGSVRTSAMEEIAGKMRALSLAATPLLSELRTASRAGLRLAAISILEMKPNPAEAQWLTDRIVTESPFVGYHAAIALLEAAKIASCDDAVQLLKALESAKQSVPASSDRATVIEQAIRILSDRCPSLATS